jgi:hypothetical protein
MTAARHLSAPLQRRAVTPLLSLVYPRTLYTDLNGLRLLASFGETGLCGGLPTYSCPREGQENRAIAEGKFFPAPRGGSRALDFTKYDTDSEV